MIASDATSWLYSRKNSLTFNWSSLALTSGGGVDLSDPFVKFGCSSFVSISKSSSNGPTGSNLWWVPSIMLSYYEKIRFYLDYMFWYSQIFWKRMETERRLTDLVDPVELLWRFRPLLIIDKVSLVESTRFDCPIISLAFRFVIRFSELMTIVSIMLFIMW